MGIVVAKAQVIAEQNKPLWCTAQKVQQPTNRRQILALQLNDSQPIMSRLNVRMYRFDKAGFSHTARAP
tara:strand:- start:2865 stop:3071 length:207 start_codon:yes stop_codon:yes gene_type:complete